MHVYTPCRCYPRGAREVYLREIFLVIPLLMGLSAGGEYPLVHRPGSSTDHPWSEAIFTGRWIRGGGEGYYGFRCPPVHS